MTDIYPRILFLSLRFTGAGKSTFINLLANYFMGGKVDKLEVAIASKHHSRVTLRNVPAGTETDIHNGTVSQTNDCSNYGFHDPSGRMKFQFIDTPGLSDTRGAAQDDVNVDKILEACEGVSALAAIILVVNGTVPRLTLVRNVDDYMSFF